MAAVLACGEGALLSHSASMALWGAAPARRDPPEVTTPRRRRHAGIRLHESETLHPADHAVVDNIPCTSVARTLLDYAESARARELRRAVDELESKRLFSGVAVQEVLARANGRRGAARLQAVLDAWREPALTRSEAERRFLELIERAGLPAPLVNTWVAGHEVDFFWPDHALVVEVDGFEHHRTRRAFEADRMRDADLGDAGLRVRRVTWRQLEDEIALAERLARVLA